MVHGGVDTASADYSDLMPLSLQRSDHIRQQLTGGRKVWGEKLINAENFHGLDGCIERFARLFRQVVAEHTCRELRTMSGL